jgi:hypothetical protein
MRFLELGASVEGGAMLSLLRIPDADRALLLRPFFIRGHGIRLLLDGRAHRFRECRGFLGCGTTFRGELEPAWDALGAACALGLPSWHPSRIDLGSETVAPPA